MDFRRHSYTGLRALIVAAALCTVAPAQAAIPASERAVLDAIYQQAHGAQWRSNSGWEGAVGTECLWQGITCDSTGTHVVGIALSENGLTGSIPALSGLAGLTSFSVARNDLSGSIPALNGLADLRYFDASGNQLSGPIPPLSGLAHLSEFLVSANHLSGNIPALNGLANLSQFYVNHNRLTGAIPDLNGLPVLDTFNASDNHLIGAIPSLAGSPKLTEFYVQNNELTGSIPTLAGLNLAAFDVSNNGLTGDPPALPNVDSFYKKFIHLCNNPLNRTPNPGWDSILGSPWYNGCASTSSQLNVSTHSEQVDMGVKLTMVLDVLAPGVASSASGLATVFDASGNETCHIVVANGKGECSLVLTGGSYAFSLGYGGSADGIFAPNATTFNAMLSSATGPGNLNQFGWTGTWYNPATGGQGMVLTVYPDLLGSGAGLLFGSWFTFGVPDSSGYPPGQRWYTFQSGVSSTNPSASFSILSSADAGSFNSPPKVGASSVGTATLSFADCAHGMLSYAFYDSGNGPVGNIPLTRLDANIACAPGGDNGAAASNYLLSGAWYDPDTSGQGLVFSVNPVSNGGNLFAGWYTYELNGGYGVCAPQDCQRWYTLQGTFPAGATSADSVPILTSTGGAFDSPTPTSIGVQVGTAKITFRSCSAMTLTYHFTAGENQGIADKTISLQRVGPAPKDCHL